MGNTTTKHERKLNTRQQKFVELIAVGTLSAVEAARQAGYPESTALAKSSKWLEDVRIQQGIAAYKRQLYSKNELPTPDDIVKILAIEAYGRGPDTTSASRVSAARTLADIAGLLGGSDRELPQALASFLDALASGTRARLEAPTRVEARAIESPRIE